MKVGYIGIFTAQYTESREYKTKPIEYSIGL